MRQLRYFLTVLRYGSINRAAKVLNITQPTLSHGIKTLERSVGAELLLRSGGGVRATLIGQVFEKYAQNILREAEKACSEVAEMRGDGQGKVSVGVASVYALSIMPRVVAKFLTLHPKVQVNTCIFTSHNDEVFKKLRAAEWDLAITHSPEDEEPPSNIGKRIIGRSVSAVFCHSSHPLARRQNVTIQEMAPFEWVVTNLGLGERILIESFRQAAFVPKVRVRADAMSFVLALCKTHNFLCIAPGDMICHEVESGALRRVDQSAIRAESQVSLLYSNVSALTSAMRTMMNLCCAETLIEPPNVPRAIRSEASQIG